VPAAAECGSLSALLVGSRGTCGRSTNPRTLPPTTRAGRRHGRVARRRANPAAPNPVADAPGETVPVPLADDETDADAAGEAEADPPVATADEPADEPLPAQTPPFAPPQPFSPPPTSTPSNPATAAPPIAPAAPHAAFTAAPPQLAAAAVNHPPAAAFGSPPLAATEPVAHHLRPAAAQTGQGRPGPLQSSMACRAPAGHGRERGPREVQVGQARPL